MFDDIRASFYKSGILSTAPFIGPESGADADGASNNDYGVSLRVRRAGKIDPDHQPFRNEGKLHQQRVYQRREKGFLEFTVIKLRNFRGERE
ncbi:hypothetical protein [Photobacterium sp. 1_MG-2023]|uniref:hypothetical protein n=1 Tax=Photobacterium sp. 1_MG-2023 TaxID=3062646 RepID=UPI0026E3F9F9|nr:hypothetical protein [Photobacterium sp. 1_MG-2023]MDO6704590.1 hypothetical protein [Photobacterium sp. 1_MG-2023]